MGKAATANSGSQHQMVRLEPGTATRVNPLKWVKQVVKKIGSAGINTQRTCYTHRLGEPRAISKHRSVFQIVGGQIWNHEHVKGSHITADHRGQNREDSDSALHGVWAERPGSGTAGPAARIGTRAQTAVACSRWFGLARDHASRSPKCHASPAMTAAPTKAATSRQVSRL